MSGFLQRLLDRGRGGGEALHPRARIERIFPAPQHSGGRGAATDPAAHAPFASLAHDQPSDVDATRSEHPAAQRTPLPSVPDPDASHLEHPLPGVRQPGTRGDDPSNLQSRLLRDRALEPGLQREVVPRHSATDAAPARLLPEQTSTPAPRSSFPRSVRVDRPAGVATASAPTPDVHIHIGRVELLAPERPAEKPRKSARAVGRPSLEDYLRGRKEGNR